MLWNKFYHRKKLENCIVACAPDSAYWASQGFSKASKIPISEGIIAKTKRRGFLQATQRQRERMASHKYIYERSKLQGKTVYLIDDSLVRGTTMWEMVKQLRLNGVSELNIGFASSKIHSPCYYGMNFPTFRELLGSHLRKDQIEMYYRARFMGYEGSKRRLITQIKEGKGLKYILSHNKNYIGKINRRKVYDPDDKRPGRFTLKYLTREEMEKAYGNSNYCQSCFTGRHWIEDWYENKDRLKIKDRIWKPLKLAV
jgi:glutamine phosphoribosylpyrophosphate amidotransferase